MPGSRGVHVVGGVGPGIGGVIKLCTVNDASIGHASGHQDLAIGQEGGGVMRPRRLHGGGREPFIGSLVKDFRILNDVKIILISRNRSSTPCCQDLAVGQEGGRVKAAVMIQLASQKERKRFVHRIVEYRLRHSFVTTPTLRKFDKIYSPRHQDSAVSQHSSSVRLAVTSHVVGVASGPGLGQGRLGQDRGQDE